MEHAAHVWYHDKVDALEKKGWERSAVFMRRLVIDAQAVVIYMAVCVLIFVIDLFTQGTAERLASPPYRYFYAKSPRSWLCLVAHVVAHKDWAHLKTNMINLLLVGPAAEREFGTQQVAIVGVVVAVASALAHMAFGHSHSGQLGGSGVVSALILLNSLGAASSGRVPLTFLLTAVFWLSDEVQSILTRDGVSHAAHLAGALVGTAAGYAIHAGRGRAKRDPNRRVSDPFGRTRSAKKLR